jgi:beta-phosphoglucomutase-like phosphatase (HAD superfamily)
MKKLGDPLPEEVIVVGDAPYDAIAARQAKLKIIGVLSGGAFPQINCGKKVASRFIVTQPTCLPVTTNRHSPKAPRVVNLKMVSRLDVIRPNVPPSAKG